MLKLRRSPRVKVVVLPAVSFQPVPTEAASGLSVFGRDRVLASVSSGVMISINSIDVHIVHEGSVGVCFAKRSRKYRIESAAMASVMFVRLVLVFAATRKEMALRSVSGFV